MRESMASLTPLFSVNRTVKEYTEQHYLPAAVTFRKRAAKNGLVGKQIIDWQHRLHQQWTSIHFGELKVETRNKQHQFEVQVYFDDMDPKLVQVELYADGVNGGEPERQAMKQGKPLVGDGRGFVYILILSANRSASDYTPRVIPNYESVAIPLEVGQILWQK